jgi:hypothetical protein
MTHYIILTDMTTLIIEYELQVKKLTIMQFTFSFHYCPFLQNVVFVVSLNLRSERFFLFRISKQPI